MEFRVGKVRAGCISRQRSLSGIPDKERLLAKFLTACASLCTRSEMHSNDVTKSARAHGSKRAIRKGRYSLEADTGAPRAEPAASRRAQPATAQKETQSVHDPLP